MHYYNFNPSDFNAKTRHLTHLERAFYRDLIDLYYTTEKPIMADLPKLERLLIAKSDDEKQALAMVLDEFFVLKNGAYHDFEMTAKIRAYKWAEKKRNTKGTENGTDKEHIGTLSGTEKERKQRHKNKVNFLRTLLSDNGIQTTTNASIKALTALCNEHKIFIDWDKAKQQAQHSGTKRNGQGTENGTDKEHIGTPKNERITINHKPITINQEPNNISPQTPQGEVSECTDEKTDKTNPPYSKAKSPSAKYADEIATIFEFWKSTFGKDPKKTKLSDVRKRKIIQRLDDGYTVDDIKTAIVNCSKSDYHITGGHTDIELICRDEVHIDRFLAMKSKPSKNPASQFGGKDDPMAVNQHWENYQPPANWEENFEKAMAMVASPTNQSNTTNTMIEI